MVERRVLSDIVWGKKGSEVMDGREDGPFRHYRGEKGSEVMDGSEEGPFRHCMGEGGK